MTTGPSFRFRLERIRALRERSEDLARQELAKAVSRLSGSRDRLGEVDAHLERIRAYQRQRLATDGSDTVSAAELLAHQAFAEHVETQRTIGVHDLEQRAADVADRDTELGRAAREHQMLERLKERRRIEHERESERRESNRLDEIAMDRSRRSAA